jgi:translocation and assembly module TamB
MRTGLKKTLKWTSLGLATLVVLVVGTVSWLLFTTSGARWAAGVVTSRFAPQVKYASLDGTIAGALTLREFKFQGPPDAARIEIASLSVEPTLRMLLSRTLRIENATVQGLVVTLPEQPGPEEPDKPLWVEPPLDIVVNDFALLDGRIVKGGEALFTVKQLGIAARWTRDEIRIDRLTLLPGDIAGSLEVKGRITPSGRLVRGEIDARWQKVLVPAQYAGRELATEGELHFDGTPKAYVAKGALQVGPPGDPTQVVLDVAGTDQRLELRSLDLKQAAGQMALSGMLEFKPVAWNLFAKASEFNPGALLTGWDGRINLDANSRGLLAEAGPRGSLQIATLSGMLRGRPIAGESDLEFAAPSQLSGDLKLSSGKSRVTVRGSNAADNEMDATVKLAVASLGDWVPETAGSLNADFRVRGRWPGLTIAGTAEGKSLTFAENRVARVQVDASVDSPLDPTGKIEVRATQLSAAGFTIASVDVNASGNQAKHRVAVKADSELLKASLEVSGGLATSPLAWRGELMRLTLDTPDIEPLQLRDPARVVFNDGDFLLGQACLVQAQSALCVDADVKKSGALQAGYSFERVPLGLANVFAAEAMPGQLRGEIAGRGDVRRAADGQWFGEANVESASAHMDMRDGQAAAALGQSTLLLYENLRVRASLQGTRATADLDAALMNGGSLKAVLGISELTAEAPGLDGTINVSMPTLAPFGGFVPTVANLDGAVTAEILVSGTAAAPEITGNVDATRLQADLGKLGIELRDGRVRGDARTGGGFKLAASVASGKGHIELAGTMNEHGVIDAHILGQNFEAADIPAASVILTPDLTLTGDPKRYLLKGEVTIPRADIDLEKLPQDKSRNVSPDVVVVRNGKEVQTATQAEALPIEAVVTVRLGDDIKITGFGLESTVTGHLVVNETPGVPTSGSGQLTVEGRYKAYGQDLTIQDGRLLFAGTPLDNPRLAIVAMRKISDEQQTGLRISGSAQRPVITVVSEPNVGEADALSYLVTGRSLNDVGSASGSSQDALSSATRSLEGAGAGLVAKRIGARLGLDEATVEENEMIGGSALTIGEYLSPRLYLSYGVGLFEPGEVIALRYKLTEDIGVRMQRGTEETRAGVEYRIEK